MARKNPTSPIRTGFNYQDIWGLYLCAQWMKKPRRFRWIRFETIPDEVNNSKFYLDDIVLLGQNDLYHLYQIKHTQNSNKDKWSWNDLLRQDKDSKGNLKESLIIKWFNSYFKEGLSNKIEKTIFITNGFPDADLSACIVDNKIDISVVEKDLPSIYSVIRNQLIDEGKIREFFSHFNFCFGQKDIDELERDARRFLYDELKATESGVTNLLLEIIKESRRPTTRNLSLAQIKDWCEFDDPRPLNERFEIPSDFEFFDEAVHKSFLNDFQNPDGGIKVIFGKPGVGKSVYLSKLDEELKNAGIISIKHHYHISPEDANPQERLNSGRVIEAIKAQFKQHDEIGDLANKNSRGIRLNEFIETLAANLYKKQTSFVVIIDGLDHVLRYGNKDELESFLTEICFPQPGLWIVVGMQMIAKDHLPQIVFDKCPEKEWLEIKGLKKEVVSRLVNANKTHINLPDNKDQLDELIDKLFEISNGNPLHLRYSLKQLKNNLGNSLATQYSCNDLIPYSGDIKKYYDALWRQLPQNSQTLLLSLASVNFTFTRQQLIECVSSFVSDPSDITHSFNAISHLVSENRRDQISVYHNSFEVFLRERPESGEQKIIIKTNIKKWLEKSNYEYLKWAELRIIEHELGNSNPILEINREWLIDAICQPCNPSQISNQMNLAAKVAFEKEDFSKAFEISHLHNYYLNSKDFVEEANELIWKEALYQNPNFFDYIDFESLPSSIFPSLAKLAESRGDSKTIYEFINILIERLNSQVQRQNTRPNITNIFLDVLPYDRRHDLNRVYRYIIQFRDEGNSASLFEIYSRRLLILDQKEKVAKLLKFDLTPSEVNKILIQCALQGFENNTEDISNFFIGKHNLPSLCLLYNFLKNQGLNNLLPLPKYNLFPYSIREHDSDERSKWSDIYHDHFLIGLLYGISNRQKDIEQWIREAPDHWSAQATCRLFEAGLKIAISIQRQKILYSDLFTPLSEIEFLRWPENRDTLNFQNAFKDAIDLILRDIIFFKKYLKDEIQIHLSDYRTITNLPHLFTKDTLISLILDIDETLLTQDVYDNIRDENTFHLSKSVNYFPERAKDYSNISKLARLYKDNNSQGFLRKAADNMLGYGYHKDVYLFYVLDAIKFCAQAGSSTKKIDEWIKRISTLIHYVGDYTDGDETNHLPFHLADILAKQRPDLLYKKYHFAADKEDLYHAEELFKYLIKALSFINDRQIALATTALDEDSFHELKNIAQNNIGARRALDNIQSYFGQIHYQKDEKQPFSGIEKEAHDHSKIEQINLLEHLNVSFENRWDRDNYLLGWFNYWLDKTGKEDIYQTFTLVAEKFGLHSLSGELLDLVFPLAYEFDNSLAFEIICQAQINDHGWQSYWSDKNKAEKRWEFIKEKYPNRYLEFFKKSANSIPIPRGIEFLLLFNEREKAETITEASIRFAESLMADLNLSVPEWISNTQEVYELDLLIQRLLWPSPLVRERAASGIAYLLINEEDKRSVYNKLLTWI